VKKFSSHLLIGSLLIIIAALLWSIDSTFLRPHLQTLPSTLVVFLEHTLGFIPLIPFLFVYRKELKKITKKQWLAIFWVALFGGALGTTFFTKALFLTGFTDISAVILLQKFQPLFAIVLAALFLHERFPPRFYLLSTLALIGGYFMTFPNPFTISTLSHTSLLIIAYALLAAFAWGSATVFGKYSLKTIPFGLLTALRFGVTMLIMVIPASRYFSTISTIHGMQWGIFGLIVVTSGAFSIYIYYSGLKRIPASLVTLCELAWPVSAVVFDYVINHTQLTVLQLLGTVVLLGTITYCTWLMRARTLIGIVHHGHKLGEKTGAKTANLDLALAKKLQDPNLIAQEITKIFNIVVEAEDFKQLENLDKRPAKQLAGEEFAGHGQPS
jgi:drug/metabolite transporter (DMT)-like permease